MIDPHSHVKVNCNSTDRAGFVRKICTIGCIGCELCVKQCPHGAIKLENNLPIVNVLICKEVCHETNCITKCPTKAIVKYKSIS